ncbi:MAG: 5'/3'-nucleotidase SurE [Sporichthyaceae bacterium]
MRVLVTNDDGIDAPGLVALVAALVEAEHEVLVAAPAHDWSGSGTALGELRDGHRVQVNRIALPDFPDVPAYIVHAPPAMSALCTVAGMFDWMPDVVVAGVNPGWNTGLTVLHSSTVGAAVTAATVGLPAVAVSCGPQPESRFDTAAAVAVAVLGDAGAGLHKGTVLNVNVPDLDLAGLRGVRPTALSARGVHAIKLSREEDGVLITGWDRRPTGEIDTDSAAVLAGWVSITEIQPSFPGELPAADDGAVALVATLLAR